MENSAAEDNRDLELKEDHAKIEANREHEEQLRATTRERRSHIAHTPTFSQEAPVSCHPRGRGQNLRRERGAKKAAGERRVSNGVTGNTQPTMGLVVLLVC